MIPNLPLPGTSAGWSGAGTTMVLLDAMREDPLAHSAACLLDQDGQTPRLARTFVTRQLATWQCSDELADRVRLVASELATNAIVHAPAPTHPALPGGEVLVALAFVSSVAVVLCVADRHGTGLPIPRIAKPGAESGRGLQIVTAESDGWGAWPRPDGAGKTIAAHFCLPAA